MSAFDRAIEKHVQRDEKGEGIAPLQCGCATCRFRRAQQALNHSLSDGVFSVEPLSEWQRIGDKSPRASLARILRGGSLVNAEQVQGGES